ncbi:hypothetical protein GCM10023091_00970 [Ravibacter arvi]|uniref:Glycosyltransferase RgtA/B/C/D-like domain-containing protein n=1 Tax=Ravibacter arvi TaxID=2051041 RepID=A0ABP8LKX5_9BACT
MLLLFRNTKIFQVLLLVFFFLAIRLPIYWSGSPLLISELGWMLTGEQLSKGFMLYRDIWENISILSGMVYWGIDVLFGRSVVAYHVIALAIGIFQVLYFNYLCTSRDFFPEASTIPGLVYAVLLNLSYDMFTLSPMLMATSFLLLAIGVIAKMIDRPEVSDEIFEAGLYIGVATLFYLPSCVFYIWAFMMMILYTGATFRHHMIGLFGSGFPLLMVALVFFLNNAMESLNRSLIATAIQIPGLKASEIIPFLVYFAFPVGLGVAGFLKLFGFNRFTHYQTRIQQVMAFWFIVSALTIPFMESLVPMNFIVFLPAIAYFVSWFFLGIRKAVRAEAIFLAYFVVTLSVLYQDVFHVIPGIPFDGIDRRIAKPALLPETINGKKILVLGEDEGEYLNNFAATPYLNWSLSVYDFENLDSFESVIHIQRNFEKDPPEFVIDKEGVMPKLFERIPELREKYKATAWKNIYQQNAGT